MQHLRPLEFPADHENVARVAQLKEYGVKPARLYAEDLIHPIHGVVAHRYENAPESEVKVAALRAVLPDGMFLTRRTAARLLGIPVDQRSDIAAHIEVGCIAPVRALRRQGIRSHQIRRKALELVPGPPDWLPTPADIWGLLGAVAEIPELVAAGDYLVSGPSREEEPLCAIADLEAAAQRFAGCSGVTKLKDALPLIRTGVESPAESKARLVIIEGGFPEPRIQCPVWTFGRALHADLGYPDLRIAIDYEGEYHFTGGLEQARRDSRRREEMRAAGWNVLTMTALDVRNPERFYPRLREAVRKALR